MAKKEKKKKKKRTPKNTLGIGERGRLIHRENKLGGKESSPGEVWLKPTGW